MIRASGIRRAAYEAGAKVFLPEQSRYVQIAIPGRSGSWPLLELFTRADNHGSGSFPFAGPRNVTFEGTVRQ